MNKRYLIENSLETSMVAYKERKKRGVKAVVILNKRIPKVLTFESTEEASRAIRGTSQRNYLQNKFYDAKKRYKKQILRFKDSDLGDCFVMRESTYNELDVCINK